MRVRSGSRWRGRGLGAGAADEVDAGGQVHQVAAAGEPLVAFIQARVPGASVTTVPATRPNQSNPLTALATSSAVASSHRPLSSPPHAATTPHWTMTIGHAVEQGLHPVLAHGGVHAAAVDVAQVLRGPAAWPRRA